MAAYEKLIDLGIFQPGEAIEKGKGVVGPASGVIPLAAPTSPVAGARLLP